MTETINTDTFSLYEDVKTYQAGDIIINFSSGYCFLYFLYEQSEYSDVQKIGEFEKSSLERFRSFFDGSMDDATEINVTFTLEQSESILKKIIAIIVVVISLTLFYIIYLLIQF